MLQEKKMLIGDGFWDKKGFFTLVWPQKIEGLGSRNRSARYESLDAASSIKLFEVWGWVHGMLTIQLTLARPSPILYTMLQKNWCENELGKTWIIRSESVEISGAEKYEIHYLYKSSEARSQAVERLFHILYLDFSAHIDDIRDDVMGHVLQVQVDGTSSAPLTKVRAEDCTPIDDSHDLKCSDRKKFSSPPITLGIMPIRRRVICNVGQNSTEESVRASTAAEMEMAQLGSRLKQYFFSPTAAGISVISSQGGSVDVSAFSPSRLSRGLFHSSSQVLSSAESLIEGVGLQEELNLH
jgi:hypothetical protein